MNEVVLGIARVLHIVAGVAMGGGALFWGLVMAPGIQRLLPPPLVGTVMGTLSPRAGRYLDRAAYLAILTGLVLLGGIVGYGQMLDILLGGGKYGSLLLGSAVAVVVMVLIGKLVLDRNAAKLTAMTPETMLPPEQIRSLQRGLAVGGLTNIALALLVLVAMATAVNIRA